jgi:hypothetical protein
MSEVVELNKFRALNKTHHGDTETRRFEGNFGARNLRAEVLSGALSGLSGGAAGFAGGEL